MEISESPEHAWIRTAEGEEENPLESGHIYISSIWLCLIAIPEFQLTVDVGFIMSDAGEAFSGRVNRPASDLCLSVNGLLVYPLTKKL